MRQTRHGPHAETHAKACLMQRLSFDLSKLTVVVPETGERLNQDTT